MGRPLQVRVALIALILSCAVSVAAEENTATPRERPVSSRVAEMLAAAMPKYESPPAPAPNATDDAAPIEIARPINSIVRLPRYIVREPRVLTPDEVMTKEARENFAMQKYLGDENGLERVLNMFSFSGLWSKLPVLGKYPFIAGQFQGPLSGPAAGAQTNQQRALEMYEKERMAERWAQLAGLMSPELKPPASQKP